MVLKFWIGVIPSGAARSYISADPCALDGVAIRQLVFFVDCSLSDRRPVLAPRGKRPQPGVSPGAHRRLKRIYLCRSLAE